MSTLVPKKSTVSMRGPKGNFLYTRDYARHIGIIAGGTGITPIFPIIRAALQDPLDKTTISLIYANKTEGDILLREELDSMSAQSGGRFKTHYVLSEITAEEEKRWKGGKGRVTAEVIKAQLPPKADGVRVLVCGMSFFRPLSFIRPLSFDGR
jgi:cytochrome-b5 reductase